MTDTNTLAPTDAEIVALMRDGNNCNHNDEAEHIEFARAVLTEWGAPAPAMSKKEMLDLLRLLSALERHILGDVP